MDNNKVKVNKELFNSLNWLKLINKNAIEIVFREKARGYIYENENFSILNKVDLETMAKIHFNDYELEEEKNYENEILNNVNGLLTKQTHKGIEKYGKKVDANDYKTEQWIDHASEEIIDMLVYLQCIKESLKNK